MASYDIVGEVGATAAPAQVVGHPGQQPVAFISANPAAYQAYMQVQPQLAMMSPQQQMAALAPIQAAFPYQGMTAPVPQLAGQPSGVSVMDRDHQPMRRLPTPIPATTCAHGAVTTITFRPQRTTRVERLVMASSVAPPTALLVNFITGTDNLFNNAGAIAISLLGSTAVDSLMRGFTCKSGKDVTLQISVPGGVDEVISGYLLGETIDE